ncbi:hypothetical protein Pan258_13100 [Symmachiella dynata]|uniref:O-antigen ligase-related domain-containing protein n=1 Tax=Symmachiella dynata TaxID=2527995 RepID=A0A517ZJZ0_9PLAN|nr:O-antigen ligase family protein [Symmachiella dynata]QDT47278.1 hypothetical protein Pan258_13100 [Symmachiella dynata]QDU42781.1 hypothetical protein Mal52_12490 [Symmachiella dynata]
MTILADIVMLAWPLLVIGLFSKLKSDKAVVVAFVVGWLFLPFKTYPISGLPDISKMSLTCYAIIAATVVFDLERFTSLRPCRYDLPIVLVCIAPAISSLTNNLGPYDAGSVMLATIVTWGGPYLLGRAYIVDSASAKFAATTLLAATLIYLPLCWFEIRMSPQLHALVYGESYRSGGMRLGGWRPAVFLDSGLQLGLWMTTASLIGIWLWWKGVWKHWGKMGTGLPLVALVVTTIFCRSTGALLLLAAGLGVLAWTSVLKNRLALLALLLVAPAYIVIRSIGDQGWQPAVEMAKSISGERAQSLEFRFQNEDILVNKALQKPAFGWGGWGRSRVYDQFGKDISVTDGLWIIQLGQYGVFGLVALFVLLLTPLGLLIKTFPVRKLMSPEIAPVLAFSIAITLFAIDCLPNAMPNPFYVMTTGGVVGYIVSYSETEVESAGPVLQKPVPVRPLRRLHAGSAAKSHVNPV